MRFSTMPINWNVPGAVLDWQFAECRPAGELGVIIVALSGSDPRAHFLTESPVVSVFKIRFSQRIGLSGQSFDSEQR
jgi:hypothetical protein